MVSSLIRIVSLVSTAVVLASFVAFAAEEAGDGSTQTVARLSDANGEAVATRAPRASIGDPSPPPRVERRREREHGAWRERLDDLGDELTGPFAGIVSSDSVWARRIASGVMALAAFGFGLGYLSRWAAARGV